MHASRGIRIHEASVRRGEDGSCVRPRGHCDRPTYTPPYIISKTPSLYFLPQIERLGFAPVQFKVYRFLY
jgi:hypothetical protein